MGILSEAILGVKANAIRPPMAPRTSGILTVGGFGQQTATQSLGMMTASGWVFAIIDRIASAVASVDWHLYQLQANGDRREILQHPLLTLWRHVNPFMTRFEFLEILGQHFELTGEMWIVLVSRTNAEGRRVGQPVEMWPVRPDHISPVPDRENFIRGYLYRVAGEAIPLDVTDVIYVRRPNPLSPYRGVSPLASIIADVEGDREAAQWQRAFFRNSAEPGGVIEVAENMDDAEWEQFTTRWRVQHQGVNNAHRVAVLEGGMKWVDRKLSQRDMQFDQMRIRSRDLILGAWGIHKAILGSSDDVNRANAEAANFTFATGLIVPRLERIKQELNASLVPLFIGGEEGALEFDYDDPTPENRELNLLEATQGFAGGVLTQNEARARMGEGEVDGGDEFKAPAPSPFVQDSVRVVEVRALSGEVTTRAEEDDADLPRALTREEARTRRAWERRLEQELGLILAHLEQSKATSRIRTKLEPSDLGGFSWDWWERHGDEVVDELERLMAIAMASEFPLLPKPELQRQARLYAEARGAELLKLDGDLSMVRMTRRRVGALVSRTIEEGESLQTLAKRLREDFAFSRNRAEMVARTETATALGQGAKQAALAEGRTQKHWVTQGDDRVDPDCSANEAQGWIEASAMFVTGRDTVPQHVRCRCVVRYRTPPVSDVDPSEGLAEDVADAIAESRTYDARCPSGHLLLRGATEKARRWCRKCKTEVVA